MKNRRKHHGKAEARPTRPQRKTLRDAIHHMIKPFFNLVEIFRRRPT
jgi:hypothetical protein